MVATGDPGGLSAPNNAASRPSSGSLTSPSTNGNSTTRRWSSSRAASPSPSPAAGSLPPFQRSSRDPRSVARCRQATRPSSQADRLAGRTIRPRRTPIHPLPTACHLRNRHPRRPRRAGMVHASIAHPDRLPTWDELKSVKAALIGPDRFAYLIFPPSWQYVNIHNFALHLWARWDSGDGAALPDFVGAFYAQT